MAYLVGKANISASSDSITIATVLRWRSIIINTPNLLPETVITIDSVPGSVGYWCYQTIKTAPAGEVAIYYTEIAASLESKTNLLFWIGLIVGAQTNDRLRFEASGKNWLINNPNLKPTPNQ
jgi:hypothetical protein